MNNKHTQPINRDDPEQDQVMRFGELPFEGDREVITLIIPEHDAQIVVRFEPDGKAILGRFSSDEDNEVALRRTIPTVGTDNRSRLVRLAHLPKPGRDQITALYNESALQRINLTAYDGEALGVSREHAALIREDTILTLIDLDSTNGTLLNGIPLPAFQSRIVRNGDELHLGMLQLTFKFSV